MKTYTLKKDSWHYWLASFGDELRMYSVYDICSYIRAMIVGSFQLLFVTVVVLFVTVVVCLIGGAILYSIGNLFSWLFLGYQLSQLTIAIFTVNNWKRMAWAFLVSIFPLSVKHGITSIGAR